MSFPLLGPPESIRTNSGRKLNAATEICSADCVGQLTFVHGDFNGGAIGTDIVAADTHVRAGIGHLNVGDEQGTDVCAVRTGLPEKSQQSRI